MSRHERRAMIDRGHHELSVVRQCELLDISRSSAYYSPVQADEYELELIGLVDKQYLLTPFYGSRKFPSQPLVGNFLTLRRHPSFHQGE